MPRYEKLSGPPPSLDEVAFLYFDDGSPVRDHWVCYCISGFEHPRRYVIAQMSAEDTDFYEYHGGRPEDRGLEIYSVYRVHGSDQVGGYDQEHIVICFGDRRSSLPGLASESAVRLMVTVHLAFSSHSWPSVYNFTAHAPSRRIASPWACTQSHEPYTSPTPPASSAHASSARPSPSPRRGTWTTTPRPSSRGAPAVVLGEGTFVAGHSG